MKSSVTGIVDIKKCGFNTRPRLMVPDVSGDGESLTDILPGAFGKFEGKKVKVTIETIINETTSAPSKRKTRRAAR